VADSLRSRTARLLLALGAIALLVVTLPGTAGAATRHQGDPRHDVARGDLGDVGYSDTPRAPRVRYDDVTAMRATFRGHRLVFSMRLVARDRLAAENYTFVAGHGRFMVIAVLATTPLDPKGAIFGFTDDMTPKAVSPTLRVEVRRGARVDDSCRPHFRSHVTRHTVRVSISTRCLAEYPSLRVLGGANRETQGGDYSDDVKPFRVRRN